MFRLLSEAKKKTGINTGNPTVNSQSSTFDTCVDEQNMTIADRFSRTAFLHSSTKMVMVE
jgi:hypothetical protein